VQQMMLDYDRRVAHYEEVYFTGVPSG
jgi:hypothetical protein